MYDNTATSSDRLAADTAVMAGAGRLMGVILEGDGTNAASVILYDNASAASGLILAKIALKASSGDLTISPTFPTGGIACNNGIFADVTGTGAAFTVYYMKG